LGESTRARRRIAPYALGAVLAAAGAAGLVAATALPGSTEEKGKKPAKAEKNALGAAGEELALGQLVYEKYCIGCHGEKGDGKGEAAKFLDPKPRNFTDPPGLFKFASVPAGQLPTDDDLFKTITRGLRGSSMPSFRFVPEEQRRAVIQYVKTFATEAWQQPRASQIDRSVNPYAQGNANPKPVEEAIEKGRLIYHAGPFKCWNCHASFMTEEELAAAGVRDLRANLDRPALKRDEWGNVNRPPDFTWHVTRASWTIDEVYQTITAGVGGAGMPTMEKQFTDEERWALAYYVKSLMDQRGRKKGPPPPALPLEE